MPPQPAARDVPTRPARTAPAGVLQVVHLDASEHTWEITPGTLAHGYGYSSQVPGPTLEATVGDTLRVRFTNSLPEPTSICWPGLRRRAATSGGTVREHAPVPPGGTVQYLLDLPEAGTFLYHSHPDHTRQTERGLYGALVVRDPAEPMLDDERVLVVGDLGISGFGDHPAPTPQPENGDVREGGLLLINGVREAQMLVTAGHQERWRLVNATIVRRLRLSLGGQPLTVLTTGRGLLDAPVAVNEVLLGPGERRDLIAGPLTAGQRLTLDAFPHDHRSGRSDAWRLATLHVA